jgi:hypothetical protein
MTPDKQFNDMFDALKKHILEGSKSQGISNTLFLKFLVYIEKIINPEFNTCLDVFKLAQDAVDSGKIPADEKIKYIELLNGASRNIEKVYEIITNAWRAYEVRIGVNSRPKDMKYVISIIDEAKIVKKNVIAAIDEIRKINKKYGVV